ncbi:MAG: class I SAM-dependent methyltransferase [Hyphomicrobiales bacterium]|nr:class I SAM-dependent methyltransferase [Hyphomicrobiales bacterium]
MDILKRIQSALQQSRRKPYDEAAWQQNVPPDVLQANYDAQQWTGPDGAWRKRNADRLSARIAELSQVSGDAVSVLDVACFSGDYYGKLAEQSGLDGKFRYTGVDVTPAYIDAAKERWRKSSANFQVGSAKSLPFGESEFDIVFNSGMLIHIDDPQGCIKECLRVAGNFALIETTTNRALFRKFIEEDKSGPKFVDRVYRHDYIRRMIASVAGIVYESSVPYGEHESTLFEVVPRKA